MPYHLIQKDVERGRESGLVSKLASQASSRDLGLFRFGGLAMQLYLKRFSLVLHLLYYSAHQSNLSMDNAQSTVEVQNSG